MPQLSFFQKCKNKARLLVYRNSKWLLSFVFVVILILFTVVLVVKTGVNIVDLEENLITEIIGAVIAFIMFTLFFDVYENRRWSGVKEFAISELCHELWSLSFKLSILCESSDTSKDELKNSRHIHNRDVVHAWADVDNVTFSEYGKRVLLGKIDDNSTLEFNSYRFISILNVGRNFFDPQIIESLMRIELNINALYEERQINKRIYDLHLSYPPSSLDISKSKIAAVYKEMVKLEEESGLTIYHVEMY